MRKLLLLAAVLLACSKQETPPPPDSTPAMAPAPAMLMPGDLAGNWNAVGMPENSDSVVNRFTFTSVTDSTGKLTAEDNKTVVLYTQKFDADSVVATSSPYINPATPKGPKVTFRSVGRLKEGKLVGTSVVMLASKPDSVVSRGRWEATRAPAK